MRKLALYALSISAAAALLAGCGGSQPLIGAPGAAPQTSALVARTNSKNYKVLHSFGATSDDGIEPGAILIDVGGTLYGTTFVGGTDGQGTVFSITPNGTEKVLYSFGESPDGSIPESSLVEVGGILYGTTSEGGSYDWCGYYSSYNVGCGTVFSITTGGTEKVLHSFGGGSFGSDGIVPVASLIEVKGMLYGTTAHGGAYDSCGDLSENCGTVFSITSSGAEKVLHSFGKGSDGATPFASLIKVKSTLYGTTAYGGANLAGTMFSITPSGTENVVHSFGGGTDGAVPEASLVEVKGTLYGTTFVGGASNCSIVSKCGTVFSITPSGTERVLHAFRGGADGAGPSAPLINVKGTLYGTTVYGGPYFCNVGGSCGTVFSITPRGKEKVLHSFGRRSDGVYPAGLIDVGGTLYGTTQNGGTYGRGTVFALIP